MMQSKTQQIQALLFVAGEAVAKTELMKLTQLTDEEVASCLEELRTALTDQGLSLITTATHAHLTTAPAVSEYLAEFLQPEDTALSKATAETLALVAYRGPISRFDIEAIRGVDTRRTLRQLVYKGFIVKQASGTKVPLYDISEEFFTHLGITSKEELPNFAVLSNHERITELLDKQK